MVSINIFKWLTNLVAVPGKRYALTLQLNAQEIPETNYRNISLPTVLVSHISRSPVERPSRMAAVNRESPPISPLTTLPLARDGIHDGRNPPNVRSISPTTYVANAEHLAVSRRQPSKASGVAVDQSLGGTHFRKME